MERKKKEGNYIFVHNQLEGDSMSKKISHSFPNHQVNPDHIDG